MKLKNKNKIIRNRILMLLVPDFGVIYTQSRPDLCSKTSLKLYFTG